MKSRLSGHGRVANPRDAFGHRCGLRLALTRNASISFVPPSVKQTTRLWLALLLSLLACAVAAKDAPLTVADPVLEAHMLRIASELRCLVCQNQTLADSDADLAQDLREQIRVMLRQGTDDAQVRRFMTDRYGDFVLYRPPWKPTTLLLWLGPAALLLGGLALLFAVLRRRARLGDALFDLDPPDVADPTETWDAPQREAATR
jgi:cytochrome c-type biogenesis protein CcmH